jgi:acyl carrier protein
VNHDDARHLFQDLLHRVAPEVDLDDVDPGALLQEEMDLDSMDFLRLVTTLYEETGIDVPERDYPRLATVEGFIGYLVAASAA